MTNPKPPSEPDGQQEQEKWYERTRYQILLFAAGIALFVVGGWILNWYIEPKTSGQKKDLVQALGLLTAGLAGAVGIYFTWRGQAQNQQATQAQLGNAQEELRLTRQGQITERFTQAIDQLGSDSLEIRLGGIYSLERTAREDRDYHWPIMEVLTTYVRTHCHRKPKEVMNPDAPSPTPVATDPFDPPAPDIQAILTVIGRRSIAHRDVEHVPIDLGYTALLLADLTGADLTGAVLTHANLMHANLQGAILQGAILTNAELVTAVFTGANLAEANLRDAELFGAFLTEANLGRANLRGANLQGADLRGADLQGADLRGANLIGANLIGADLSNADLSNADLLGVLLSGANLQGADLRGANLSEANLSGANLSRAHLGGVDDIEGPLWEGELPSARLTQAQLDRALGDKDTLLPDALKPPAFWGVNADEPSEED